MKFVFVLIVFSTFQSSGVGFSHTFKTESACVEAAQKIEQELWGTAICIKDEAP